MSELLQYKCPCCGGAIEFDSSLQKMKCPYCDTEFDVETLKGYDEDLKKESEMEDSMEWDSSPGSDWQDAETEGIHVYVCQSCGGEIVCDENRAAMSCPYCDNPVVMKGNLSGELRPDCVIPFRLDKKAAKEGFRRHLKGKLLLPKVFRTEHHLDEIKGIYVPFWLFDAEADAQIRYKATRVRMWSDSDYDYTETSYYAVFRSGRIAFDKVPVDGSTRMADDLMESLEPFDFRDAVDFQTAYLAGYLADKYDVDAKKSIQRANDRIRRGTGDEFRSTVKGYSTVMTENVNIQLKNGKETYALYPVWILNTTWRGTKYVFAMNGQTGKFVGNLPLDKGAFAAYFGGLTALCSGIVFLILSLMWFL